MAAFCNSKAKKFNVELCFDHGFVQLGPGGDAVP